MTRKYLLTAQVIEYVFTFLYAIVTALFFSVSEGIYVLFLILALLSLCLGLYTESIKGRLGGAAMQKADFITLIVITCLSVIACPACLFNLLALLNKGEDKYQNVGINDNLLVRSGYILTGWNTNAQGTGIHYDLGATVSKIYTKNKGKMTLYAEWTPIVYTITYDLNDTLEDPAVNHAANAYAYSIVKAPTLKNPARTGYTFGGWYQDDEFLNRVKSIKKADGIDYILYAKWTENVYSVTFNSNGGKVLDKDAVAKKAGIKYTENITLPEASALDRPGYVFTGWNTKKNGTGNWYMDGMEANRIGSKNKGNVVLYAQWMKID